LSEFLKISKALILQDLPDRINPVSDNANDRQCWQIGTEGELPVSPALKSAKMGVFSVFQYPHDRFSKSASRS